MSSTHSVRINNVDIEWNVERGDLRFFGVDAVLFWTDPSMYRLLAPLVDEIGVELFRVLVAHSSSLGTDTDYEVMVTKLGSDFVSGFLAWGEAVATAGWGRFEVLRHDPATATALVRVTNPWELQMQRGHATPWGCPFLQGKIIGLFSIAFGRACWADETIGGDAEQPHVDLAIYPSERGLDRELARLRRGRSAEREGELMQRIEAATVELRAKLAVIEEQRALISALRCPILQVWSGVLAAVLVGELGELAMRDLTQHLLERVQVSRATEVILDCTGVPTLGERESGALGRLVAALRLLGARTTLVGLSPALARGLAADAAALPGARTLQSLEDALQRVVGLRRA
jgi:anti-anti-sigma regulatory factor